MKAGKAECGAVFLVTESGSQADGSKGRGPIDAGAHPHLALEFLLISAAPGHGCRGLGRHYRAPLSGNDPARRGWTLFPDAKQAAAATEGRIWSVIEGVPLEDTPVHPGSQMSELAHQARQIGYRELNLDFTNCTGAGHGRVWCACAPAKATTHGVLPTRGRASIIASLPLQIAPMTEPATPLMQQYHAVKKQHPAALLLFRLGDFYELFYEDAVVASRILQITLTARNKEKGEPVPMCGVPYHAAENYIARLIRAGHKVAICEQMEEPGPGKKLVRREVIRVLTPGTATGASLIEAKENNFLAAVARSGAAHAAAQGGRSSSRAADARIGLAFVDLSTGEFRATEFSGEKAEARLRDELGILRPREVIVPRPATLFPDAAPASLNGLGAAETCLDDWIFEKNYAARQIEEQFHVMALDGFGLASHPQAIAAAGAIVHYLRDTSAISARKPEDAAAIPSLRPAGTGLEHLDRIAYYEQQDAMILDQVTVRNLELVEPAAGDDASATLVRAIDETATSMGARLLRSWILRPEISFEEIEARLEAVAALKAETIAREEIRRELEGILDLERLTSRVTLGIATPRDLLALHTSLEAIPRVRGLMAPLPALQTADRSSSTSGRLRSLWDQMDELADIRDTIARSIADDPPALATEPGVIRRGFHAELDELRDILKQNRQIIAAMEERERKRTGIASLKIRYNQVFGYYIEISKPNLSLAPADYERKQTLVNAERFTSGELKEYERKALSAEERGLEIERRVYGEIRESIAREAGRLRRTAAAIAQLDVLVNFARIAAARNYTRPEFTGRELPKAGPRGELLIAGGRHPVIEKLLEERGERFVPNDLYLDDDSRFLLIITGPNMGGKSTYLRQTALISILAQMGSFVPAAQAKLPLVDRIFTRIGASDSMARGRSTFLVEMSEVAAILNTATVASLVLLDEVGRGTATFDGLAIAWAVVESLHTGARPRTLFATHYHELTDLEQMLPGVKNVHVSVEEAGSDIVFLKRVEPGGADKSYGIEVARLAGLPNDVIVRAREILRQHERSEEKLAEQLAERATPGATPAPARQTSFTAIDESVLDALRGADLNKLTPLEALNLLSALQRQLE
jgi:DNA mismatch repair protein MutS